MHEKNDIALAQVSLRVEERCYVIRKGKTDDKAQLEREEKMVCSKAGKKKTDENVAVVSFFSRFFTAMRPLFTLQLSCAKALSFYPTSYHCVFA